jgi:glycosyltransferase involved in cell wall biosynthesis
MISRVLYTAAHGGFSHERVPLGGGAAVFEHLVEAWQRAKPFEVRAITPAILGENAPGGRDLVNFSESGYARFSRAFEKAATEEILRHSPEKSVVLANDVSEGPDFRTLAERGFAVFTIFHVDVVAYISDIYLRGCVRPETAVRWYPKLRPILPGIARLIWEKQEACVRYSRGLIVPSEGMRDVLSRCYPEFAGSKLHVLPWGSWQDAARGDPEPLRKEYGVPPDTRVLLTLSRISPEKGQDLLLDALYEWEHRADFPRYPLWLFICGEAAFMKGRHFLETLQRKAARLQRTRVVFPGYVTGERKRAFFALADLYVFPSRHESYGLTLMEALSAGLPAVCLDHHGARSVMREEFGALVRPRELAGSIQRILSDDQARARMSAAARAYAAAERFSDRAMELASLLKGQLRTPEAGLE